MAKKDKDVKEKSATELLVDSVQDLAAKLDFKVKATTESVKDLVDIVKGDNPEQPTETEPIKITETVEEVEAVVTKGTQFRLKHGQCAIKRKDGKGGICLVMEKHFESKYSKDWIKIESKKK